MPQVSALAIRELTPPRDALAWFEPLRRQPSPWLLESAAVVEGLSRWTFMGADPYRALRTRGRESEVAVLREVRDDLPLGRHARDGDPLTLLQSLVPRPSNVEAVGRGIALPPPFLTGAVGYLGYELAECCEPVRLRARDDFGLPDLVMHYHDRVLAIDHVARRAYAIGLGFASGEREALAHERAAQAAHAIEGLVASSIGQEDRRNLDRPSPLRDVLERALPADAESCLDAAGYAASVEAIREEIAAGNVYQANLTQRIDLPRRADRGAGDAEVGWSCYRALRAINPAPFAAYLAFDEVTVVSSSPERFLRLDRDRTVESRPIKGTRRRGRSPEEDVLLAKELAESEKDRAENLMIVDLVRNDLGRVCETGSVHVPDLMSIETHATVYQMVSTVRGRLREDRSAADLVRATFPPGSMTGAPKIAAMELIDRLEPVRRGIYSGAIGYFDAAGGVDLSVVIRTLFVREGRVHLHGGGAVVNDSDPQAEYRESLDKVRALLAAVASAERNR